MNADLCPCPGGGTPRLHLTFHRLARPGLVPIL